MLQSSLRSRCRVRCARVAEFAALTLQEFAALTLQEFAALTLQSSLRSRCRSCRLQLLQERDSLQPLQSERSDLQPTLNEKTAAHRRARYARWGITILSFHYIIIHSTTERAEI